MMIDIIDTCVNLFGIEIEPLGSTVDSKHICHHIELTWTCYPVTTILSLSHLMSSRSWVIRQGSSTPSLKRNKNLYQILTCKWRSCFSWPWLDDQSKKCDTVSIMILIHDHDAVKLRGVPWSQQVSGGNGLQESQRLLHLLPEYVPDTCILYIRWP